MKVENLILVTFKIAICLALAGELGHATLYFAKQAAHERQFGLISLGKFSRSLEAGGTVLHRHSR